MKAFQLILFFTSLLGFTHDGLAQTAKKPNILFIMSDDHAAEAIGAYGSHLASLNPTPHLDELAAKGILFENTFCTNSICVPSRATILTGQHSQSNGVLGLDESLPAEKQYLPIEMKKLGYSTAIIGKYHLKEEPAAFDYYKVLPNQGDYFDPTFRVRGTKPWPNNTVKTEGHSSDVITDLSIDYLKKRDRTKPFLLLHHYKAPHGPFHSAPRYAQHLEKTFIPFPESLFHQAQWGSNATRGENDSLVRFIGTSISARHVFGGSSEPWVGNNEAKKQSTQEAYQKHLKNYLRCVKGIDDNLGKLFQFLKDEGLWENTIIIYTSDQGMMLGAHDFTDKRWMYDESLRMPFIVHYPPMIKAGRRTNLLVNNTDFAPTLLALAGGKAPPQMQGRSFLKTLKGETETNWRKATYYRYWRHLVGHFVPAHFGIRTREYKLIFFYGAHHRPKKEFNNFYWGKRYGDIVAKQTPPAWEFYDLKKDPHELVNKYDDPAYAETITALKKELKQQRIQLKETDENYPKLQAIIEENWN